MSSSQPFFGVCQSEVTERLTELSELGAELSELSLLNQCSRNSMPPISFIIMAQTAE